MKIIFLVIMIIMFVVITACQSKKDCGSDLTCYVDALKKCAAAQYSKSEGDQFAQMEVIGLQGDICDTVWKSNDGEMDCKIPKQDLNNVTEDDLMGDYTVGEICKGSLADLLINSLSPLEQ